MDFHKFICRSRPGSLVPLIEIEECDGEKPVSFSGDTALGLATAESQIQTDTLVDSHLSYSTHRTRLITPK